MSILWDFSCKNRRQNRTKQAGQQGTDHLQMQSKKLYLFVPLTRIRTMTRICFALIALAIPLAISVQAVAGQEPEVEVDWRQHIIPIEARTFDYKTVPRGSAPEHRFILRNPFKESIHIDAVTTSCTCTTVDFDEEKTILQTYEEAIITVRLRGDMFEGPRNSTITVSIDKPIRTEIQLHVRGEIRSDLNISPNFIDFGNIELGRGHSRTLTVTYTGPNTQWRLVDVQCENEFIRAEITSEPARVGMRVFRVNVSLDRAAPNGTINSHLVLISNDALNRREIPIPIRATVGAVIRVSPPALSLGILSPGEGSQVRDAILLGTQPFRITKIESDNPALEVTSKNPPEAELRLHSLSISYRNPADGEGAPQEGIMRAIVQVTTNIPGLTPMFFVTASVRGEE